MTTDCLDWALESGQRFGVLGGMTPHERRLLRERTTYAAARFS